MLETNRKKLILKKLNDMFDELNDITARIANEETEEKARDNFDDILVFAYISGFTAINYLLDKEMELPKDYRKKAVDKDYNGVSIDEKLKGYYETGDLTRIKTLLDSEVHRTYEQGKQDGAEKSGVNLVKVWQTQLDDKVRDTHAYLEGVEAPLDGYFVTFDGDKALFPGGFDLPQNNANCRCYIDYEQA